MKMNKNSQSENPFGLAVPIYRGNRIRTCDLTAPSRAL